MVTAETTATTAVAIRVVMIETSKEEEEEAAAAAAEREEKAATAGTVVRVRDHHMGVVRAGVAVEVVLVAAIAMAVVGTVAEIIASATILAAMIPLPLWAIAAAPPAARDSVCPIAPLKAPRI